MQVEQSNADRCPPGRRSRIARLALHRSRGGPEREIAVGGVRLCRRCFALSVGAVAGAVVGVAVMVPVGWLALLLLPMALEVTAEKGFGTGHRPRMVAIGSVLAGLAMGATIAWLLVVAGPVALALAVAGVWVAAQVALVLRRRSLWHAHGEGAR